jgi:hypothetical protein
MKTRRKLGNGNDIGAAAAAETGDSSFSVDIGDDYKEMMKNMNTNKRMVIIMRGSCNDDNVGGPDSGVWCENSNEDGNADYENVANEDEGGWAEGRGLFRQRRLYR